MTQPNVDPKNIPATEATTAAGADQTKAETPAKVEKPKMPSQNGITRPRPETLCGQVWAKADEMSAAKNGPVAIGDLLVETDKLGLNQGNVRCEYAAWRKFNGVTGRILSEKQVAEKAKKEEEKAKRLAEKEAKKAEKEAEKAKKAEERAQAKAEKEAEKKRKAEERAAKKAEAEKKKAEKAEKAKAEKAAKAAAKAQADQAANSTDAE